MNNVQKSLAVYAIILAMTAVPASQMISEKSSLKAELALLQKGGRGSNHRTSRGESGSFSGSGVNERTGYEIFAIQSEAVNAEGLLRQLSQAMATMNGTALLKPFLMIPELSDKELAQLIQDVQQAEGEGDVKRRALKVLLEMSWLRGNLNHQERIEQLFAFTETRRGVGKELKDWGAENPAEALAWLKEKTLSEGSVGFGARDEYNSHFSDIVRGALEGEHPLGAELYSSANDAVRQSASQSFIGSLSRGIQETKTLSRLEGFLAAEDDSKIRNGVLSRVAGKISEETGDLELGGAVLALIDDSRMRVYEMSTFAAQAKDMALSERLTWLQGQVEADDFRRHVGMVFTWGQADYSEAEQWIAGQSDGWVIDQARSGWTSGLVNAEEFELAYSQATQIKDDYSRLKAIETVAIDWLLKDSEAALLVLPESALVTVGGKPIQR